MRAILLALLAPLVITGCFGPEVLDPDAGKVRVTIADNEFQPQLLEAEVGSLVLWTHRGQENHTVTLRAPTGTILADQADPGLAEGNRFEFLFSQAGNYTVSCRYHSPDGQAGMAMRLTITAATT